MRAFAIIVMLAILPLGVLAQSRAVVVVCLADRAPPITLDMWRPSAFGVEMHCIDAAFIAKLVPCAPEGGYGMSSEDGGLLRGITTIETEAFANVGGLTYVRIAPLTIEFWTGKSLGTGETPARDWTYTIDRISGAALLQQDGLRTVYTCGVVR